MKPALRGGTASPNPSASRISVLNMAFKPRSIYVTLFFLLTGSLLLVVTNFSLALTGNPNLRTHDVLHLGLQQPWSFTYHPSAPSPMTHTDIVQEFRGTAVDHIHETYRVPKVFLRNMSVDMLKRLKRRCLGMAAELAAKRKEQGLEVTPETTRPRMVIVHVQNGLGNRMRVVASALAYSILHENPIVVVVWELDRHMGAKFLDLFEDDGDLVIVDKLNEQWPLEQSRGADPAWQHVDVYNYMEHEANSNKGQMVINNPDKHVYFRGCELLEIERMDLMHAKSGRASRAMTPVPEVQAMVDKIRQPPSGRTRSMIGVHIRQMSIHDEFTPDFDPVKEYGKDSAEKMDLWRAKTSVSVFIDEMHAQERNFNNREIKFYVAADSRSVFDELEEEFPGRIEHQSLDLISECENKRGVKCTRLALADILCLSKTKIFLGSHYSSFSSMVQKLGMRNWRRAGIDFAVE